MQLSKAGYTFVAMSVRWAHACMCVCVSVWVGMCGRWIFYIMQKKEPQSGCWYLVIIVASNINDAVWSTGQWHL